MWYFWHQIFSVVAIGSCHSKDNDSTAITKKGQTMLSEDHCVWICLFLPMWGWPRLRHPCAPFSPTSVSNWQQTNRDRDHSLFIDNELLLCFTPVRLRHICLCCLTTRPCWLKRLHCETFIEVYFPKLAPSWVRLSWYTKSNGKCDSVTSLSFVFWVCCGVGQQSFFTESLQWSPTVCDM